MTYLTAAAAFSVLMIIFSTMVTALTESYLRITAVRGKLLAQSILKFLKDDRTIARFLEARPKTEKDNARPEVGGIGLAEDKWILSAYDTLTLNQSVGEPVTLSNWVARKFRYVFSPQWARKLVGLQDNSLRRIDRLSTYSFLQRLAQTEIGRSIAREGEEMVLRSMTIGFERYVAASNEVFRKHAQAMTMFLSFVFAFAFNVDAVRVFQHLVENPQTSQQLIEDGEAAYAQNQAAAARFANALTNLQIELQNGEQIEDDSLEAVNGALTKAKTEIDETLAAVDQISKEMGMPIGWKLYPYGDQQVESGQEVDNPSFIRWLFGVLLAGFLIGLGGPFWYKVFSSLSHIIQVLRTLRGEPRKEVIETEKTSDQPASQQLVKAVLGDETGKGDLMAHFRASTGLHPREFNASYT